MPRAIHKLTARRVETEKRVGKHADGGGLWLFITKDGSKRWVFAYEREKRRREMGLTWAEVDLDAAVWTIPADRMKMGVEHRVPLCNAAVQLLRSLAGGSNCPPDAYVFAGQKMGNPLSQMTMTMVLRRMQLGHLTVHGMRSSFRDYMGEMTTHPETVVEQALAHQIGDETSRAYRRGDAFLKRRVLMNDWEAYLLKPQKPASAVAKIDRRAKAA